MLTFMAIIAIVCVGIFCWLPGEVKLQKRSRALRSIGCAIMLYANEHEGAYPEDLDQLDRDLHGDIDTVCRIVWGKSPSRALRYDPRATAVSAALLVDIESGLVLHGDLQVDRP